jgi:hypothetical protein
MWYYPANPFVIDHSPEAAEAALIFPRAVVDTVINAPIEAASEVLREEGLEDSYTSYAYALFVELPARSIVAREANTAALEGRAIDLSLLHFAAIGGKHYGGIDAMTDGLNRFSLTSLQELTASESLAMFASGASQYAGTFAAGAGTPAAATKITQGSIKVRRGPALGCLSGYRESCKSRFSTSPRARVPLPVVGLQEHLQSRLVDLRYRARELKEAPYFDSLCLIGNSSRMRGLFFRISRIPKMQD